MAGSSFGNLFRITTFGESHGVALGAVVDGCPAGLPLSEEDIQPYLDRRRPGQSDITTSRKEPDRIRILSGVFEGKTTGTPIAFLMENEDHHSADYSNIADKFRPGHADFGFEEKYGFRDYRGGGRSSGRETAARVAGGALAIRLLKEFGITVCAYTSSIGDVEAPFTDREEILKNPVFMPDKKAAEKAVELIKKVAEDRDSVGGCITCFADGLPAGLGEPVFEKLDALLSHALVSVGAVKGIEIGDGFLAAGPSSRGSVNNDEFMMENGVVKKKTNHSGGVLGGISDGSRLITRVAIKPTPSIARAQKTVTKDKEETEILIHGRHDPVVVPRAVVVVECMTALVLADLLLMNATSKLENLKKIYGNENTLPPA